MSLAERLVDRLDRTARRHGPRADGAPWRLPGFVVASVQALEAVPDPALHEAYLHAYGEALPARAARRLARRDDALGRILWGGWHAARTPRLTAALDGLEATAAAAGGSPWPGGLRSWHAQHGCLARAVPHTFYGPALPLAGAYPEEVRRLQAEADAGTPWEVLLDHRLAGPWLHELTHGLDRPWSEGAGSWMALECAAAWTALQAWPRHLFPRQAGEAVVGLARYGLIGRVLARRRGDDAVVRWALSSTDPTTLPGRLLGHALVAAEWQVWRARPQPPFAPDNRHAEGWVRLIQAAHPGGPLQRWLEPLADRDALTPMDVADLPDLLTRAERLSLDALPCWDATRSPQERDEVREALQALGQVTLAHRTREGAAVAEVVPDPLPDHTVIVEPAQGWIRARPRAHGAYGEPAWWTLPPALCRRLARRGLTRLTLTGVDPRHPEPALHTLLDLSEGGPPVQPTLELNLHRGRPRAAGLTVMRPPPPPTRLAYGTPMLTLGSCFAQTVGEGLAQRGLPVSVNPFGILYDPSAVARALRWIAHDDPLPDTHVFRDRGRWHSPLFHTDRSHADRETALTAMRQSLDHARAAAAQAEVLVITWGTAVVHHDRALDTDVSNCHGLDPSRFSRRRMSVDDVVAATGDALHLLQRHRGPKTVILTVSPVRHTALGLSENTLSKATLHLAAEALAQRREEVHRFGAYEIVMDELRDHRWFDADGIHPSPAAVEVVLERFVDTQLSDEARREVRRREALTEALSDLPRDPLRRDERLAHLLERASAAPLDPDAPTLDGLTSWLRQERDRLAPVVEAARPVPELPPEPPAVEPPPAPSAPAPDPDALRARLEALAPGEGFVDFEAVPALQEAVDHLLDALPAVPTPESPVLAEALYGRLVGLSDRVESADECLAERAGRALALAAPAWPPARLARELLTLEARGWWRPDALADLDRLPTQTRRAAASRLQAAASTLHPRRADPLASWVDRWVSARSPMPVDNSVDEQADRRR